MTEPHDCEAAKSLERAVELLEGWLGGNHFGLETDTREFLAQQSDESA